MNNYLSHHGIEGQKWYKRNGPPYPLDYNDHSAAEKKALKKDMKWLNKNDQKLQKQAKTKSKKELDEYAKLLSQKYPLNANGKVSRSFINAYNKGMAALMNEKIDGLESPSGRVVQFVAKRGELGVFTALADRGYDMSQVKNGIWGSGRIAYKQTMVEKAE